MRYGERFLLLPINPIYMKPKSHAAIVKSMKAYKKKKSDDSTANAIGKKLAEIKKSSKNTDREGNLALFRHLNF